MMNTAHKQQHSQHSEAGRSAFNRRFFVLLCVAVLVLLAVAEALVEHHGHFGIDNRYGFYTVYAFLAASSLFALSYLLGRLFGKPYANEAEQERVE